MATIYDLQAAAGNVHRELSFDVDGRFVRYVGVSVTEGSDGVAHMVVALTEKPEEAPVPDQTAQDMPSEPVEVTQE